MRVTTFRTPPKRKTIIVLWGTLTIAGCAPVNVRFGDQTERTRMSLLSRDLGSLDDSVVCGEDSVGNVTCHVMHTRKASMKRSLRASRKDVLEHGIRVIDSIVCAVSDRRGSSCIDVLSSRHWELDHGSVVEGRKAAFWNIGWCVEEERRGEISRYECVSPGSIDVRFGFWGSGDAEIAEFVTGSCICSAADSRVSSKNIDLPIMGVVCTWGWGNEPWLFHQAEQSFGGERARVVAFTTELNPLADYSYICDSVRERTPAEAEKYLLELIATEGAAVIDPAI